jgi:uncharacterized membrane protein YheB (UPF0754 family)
LHKITFKKQGYFFDTFAQLKKKMPLLTSLLFLAVAAFGGWLIASFFVIILFRPYHKKKLLGYSITGIIPALKPEMAKLLAAAIQHELLSVESIEKRIDDPELMAQLRPEIEQHIDVFLKEKLKTAFPLLAGLMGEKTLNTLKGAFLTEVETIFPSVLKNFSGKLLEQWQPLTLIEKKLAEMNLAEIEKMVRVKAARSILLLKLIGVLTGLMTGFLQLLIIRYTR